MKKIKQKLTGSILGVFLFTGAILPVTVFAQDYEDSPFGFIQGGWDHENDLGVHWDNPCRSAIGVDLESGEDLNVEEDVDFLKLDEIVQEYVIDNNINILIAISPFRNKPILGSEPNFLTPVEYAELVSYVVERYDGDEIDDMEGSPTLKYWYLGYNEMDNKDYSNAEQIADLVASGYDAVKNQNSNFIPILGGSGGIDGTWEEGGLYYNIISELSDLSSCQDIMIDYHYWSPPEEWKGQVEKLNQVQNTLENFGFTNNRIFTKEGGSWDEFRGFTEIDQAGDVIRRYVHSIANGLEKLFWSRVVEYNIDTWPPFDYIGLINNPANDPVGEEKDWKKLSYYTYKLMVEKLEGSNWDSIITVIDSIDNKYAYKFINDSTGEPTYVAWWDYFEDPTYTVGDSSLIMLTGMSSNQIIITNAVPNDTSGINVTDYNTAFSIDTLNVTSGSVSFYLKEYPVFVEEYNASSVNEINLIGENIKIYPNPTNGIFTIQGKNIQSIEVLNISGQTIKQLSNNQSTIINLKDQRKGIYMIKMVTDKGISVEKLVLK